MFKSSVASVDASMQPDFKKKEKLQQLQRWLLQQKLQKVQQHRKLQLPHQPPSIHSSLARFVPAPLPRPKDPTRLAFEGLAKSSARCSQKRPRSALVTTVSTSTSSARIPHAASTSMLLNLAEIHELLRRLSPAARRHTLSHLLSEQARKLLELWIVKGGSGGSGGGSRGRSSLGGEFVQFAMPRRTTQRPPKFERMKNRAPVRQVGKRVRVLKTGQQSTDYCGRVCFPGFVVHTASCRERSVVEEGCKRLNAARSRLEFLLKLGPARTATCQSASDELLYFDCAVNKSLQEFGFITNATACKGGSHQQPEEAPTLPMDMTKFSCSLSSSDEESSNYSADSIPMQPQTSESGGSICAASHGGDARATQNEASVSPIAKRALTAAAARGDGGGGGGGAANPNISFTVGVQLGRTFRCLVRLPCIADLDTALRWRREILAIRGNGHLRDLCFSDREERLQTIQQKVLQAHTEASSCLSMEQRRRILAAFDRIERTLNEQSDQCNLERLRRLLRKSGLGSQQPARAEVPACCA